MFGTSLMIVMGCGVDSVCVREGGTVQTDGRTDGAGGYESMAGLTGLGSVDR